MKTYNQFRPKLTFCLKNNFFSSVISVRSVVNFLGFNQILHYLHHRVLFPEPPRFRYQAEAGKRSVGKGAQGDPGQDFIFNAEGRGGQTDEDTHGQVPSG
jgi:hypothetical protein